MIVSDERRLLFVHVQKTGGLTVSRLVEDALPDAHVPRELRHDRHVHLGEILAARPELGSYFTFGFVRNPWARLLSWHAMIMRRQAAAAAGNEVVARRVRRNPFWRTVVRDYTRFEDFVLRGPEEFERLRTAQLDYLRAGHREADFIGRTEALDHDVAEVFSRLDLPKPVVRRRNRGEVVDYRGAYTPAMRDRVREIFAPDIERFGYEF